MTYTHRLCLLVVIAALVSGTALSLPRFASRMGAKCQSCHVNPTGAEMRRAFGVQYGKEQLPLPAWSKDFELEDLSSMLTNVLGVGADFRTLYFYRQQGGSNSNAFFEMQGDIYLDFTVAKKVHMFINKGLRSGFEAFGLLDILPASGNIKIGKFVPAFGTRIDDHTTYIRTWTGFSPELGRPELTGAEVGISPGPMTIIGGIYNAQDDFGSATRNQKAYLGRAEGMFSVGENVHIGLGADVFSRQTFYGFATTLIGGLGSISYKNCTLFGEIDFIKNNTDNGNTLTSGTDGIVGYGEFDFMVTQGLDLKLAYDYYDKDKNVQSGALSRYTAGFEFFPINGVEVRPLYRIIRTLPADTKNGEFDLIVHFYI